MIEKIEKERRLGGWIITYGKEKDDTGRWRPKIFE